MPTSTSYSTVPYYSTVQQSRRRPSLHQASVKKGGPRGVSPLVRSGGGLKNRRFPPPHPSDDNVLYSIFAPCLVSLHICITGFSLYIPVLLHHSLLSCNGLRECCSYVSRPKIILRDYIGLYCTFRSRSRTLCSRYEVLLLVVISDSVEPRTTATGGGLVDL